MDKMRIHLAVIVWALMLISSTGGTFKGIFSETSYLPDLLEIDKTYYWRVDEFDVTTTHKGQIWKFTTASDKVESD